MPELFENGSFDEDIGDEDDAKGSSPELPAPKSGDEEGFDDASSSCIDTGSGII